MTLRTDHVGQGDAVRCCLGGGDGHPVLIWSSRCPPVPPSPFHEMSGPSSDWTVVSWTQAPSLLCDRCAGDVLWVLEPSPRHGPSPADLAQALHNFAGRIRTLVLLPETRTHECSQWLDAGADRCMPASSPPDLIQAMVHAMLRRCQGMATSISVFGTLRFDHASRTLFHGDRHIWLTGRETQVAAVLFRSSLHRSHTVEVLKALGTEESSRPHKALAALYVHRINRKIRPHGVEIDAIRGFGYSLRLLTPGMRQAVSARASANSLTQWLRTAQPAKPGEAALRP